MGATDELDKRMKEKPTIGQRLYCLNVGNSARNVQQELRPVAVTKVGRKYFTVETEGPYKRSIEFRIEDWRERTDFMPNNHLYSDPQDWEDEKEAAQLSDRLRKEFTAWGASQLPLEKLRRIAAILEKPTP